MPLPKIVVHGRASGFFFVYFDNSGLRSKQIDLDHAHLGVSPHAHDGYFHSEFRKNLTTEERAMVDRVIRIWEDYKRRQ